MGRDALRAEVGPSTGLIVRRVVRAELGPSMGLISRCGVARIERAVRKHLMRGLLGLDTRRSPENGEMG